MTTATRDLSTVQVSPRDDGSYGVLSSNGTDIYTVRLSSEGNTCTCPAGRSGRNCYHVAAVIAQYTPRCYHCGSTGNNVATFINDWDDNADIMLCTACVASPYAAAL